MALSMSPRGKLQLLKFEGMRLHPYDDRTGKPVQVWNKWTTIGVGYLVPAEEFQELSQGISVEKAMHLMENSLLPVERAVSKVVRGVTQVQFDMLCCLAYNIGITKFISSSVVKLLNKQTARYSTLEEAWLAWNKDEGKVSPSLLTRRKEEYRVFQEGYTL